MKSNDFDKIAFIYDRLAQLVFGKSIIESQAFFLSQIPEHAQVLILGGGSGWIIEELLAVKPAVEICYIEASGKMISQANARLPNDRRVQFIQGTERDIPSRPFNAVITNFYLDLFDEDSIKRVLNKIKQNLAPNATWIATDFVDHKWWHRVMLKTMYAFFRVAAKIEARKLPSWNAAVALVGGQKTDSKFFYMGFIETSVFQF